MALNICRQETLKCEEDNLRMQCNITNEKNTGQDAQLCRICFAPNGNLCSMKIDQNLNHAYGTLTGLSIQQEENMPPYLCTECCAQLMCCFHFRNKALRAHLLLLEVLRKHGCIKLEAIKSLNESQDVNTSTPDVTYNSLDQFNQESVNNNIKKEVEYVNELCIRIEPSSEELFSIDNIKQECINENRIEEEKKVSSPLHDIFLTDIKAENDANNDIVSNDIASDEYNDESESKCDDLINQDKLSKFKVKKISKKRIGKSLKHISGTKLLSYNKLCCDMCSYKTASDEKLLHHLKTHANTLPHKCSHTTNIIQNVNSNGKRISCNLCNKTYSSKFGLQKHMKVHSGEKPFNCDMCEKSFIEKRDLQNHLRTHSGEKPFGCDLCKRSFSERGNLLRHIRIHSGEKPFECNFCKKTYSQRHHLKRHMTKHY